MIGNKTDKMPYSVRTCTIRKKSEAQQQQSQTAGQPSIQEMFVMREYRLAKFIDIAAQVITNCQRKLSGMVSVAIK